MNFPFFLVIFAVLAFALLRLGLVSTMVAIFFVNVLLQTPGAQELTKPYESAVVLYPALVAGHRDLGLLAHVGPAAYDRAGG